jgi:hypothetical protein
MEYIAMTFLVAAAVLAVTLLAGALVAPRPFHHLVFRVDACMLESGDWGVLDSGCPDIAMIPAGRTRIGKINRARSG